MVNDSERVEVTDEDFISYLNETLIPDLYESGMNATAADFERCVTIIRKGKASVETARKEIPPGWELRPRPCHHHVPCADPGGCSGKELVRIGS